MLRTHLIDLLFEVLAFDEALLNGITFELAFCAVGVGVVVVVLRPVSCMQCISVFSRNLLWIINYTLFKSVSCMEIEGTISYINVLSVLSLVLSLRLCHH